MAKFVLNYRERTKLQDFVAHTRDARLSRRGYALLWLDDGEPALEIAAQFNVSRQTVYNWADRFKERKGLPLAMRLADGVRSGRPYTAHGVIDPLIEAVIDTAPHVWGYRSTIWTAPLLVAYLSDYHHLTVSCQSVRLAIVRLKLRWKRPRHRLALRPDTWQQAKGGLKHGLFTRARTVILMLDETLILETPPLTSCYCQIGEQRCVPITGNRTKRVLHGVLNIGSGDALSLVTAKWTQETHQDFLRMIRAHWRGWHSVLFEDRASQHTADASRDLADELEIQIRFLPRATPELNAMDHLWRHTRRYGLANRATQSVAQSAETACRYILDLHPRERLRKAGVLSGNFWLTK